MKFYHKFYPTILQQSLQNFCSDGLFCDIKLVVDGYEFQAHKLILSAASPYFRSMFNTETAFLEAKQEKVNLYEIDKNAMSLILNFIYSSDIEINDKNVYKLMEAANLLQVHALRAYISFYLQNSLSVENCVHLYVMASLYQYPDLAKKALHFLLINFSKVIEHDDILEAPFETILEILSSRLLDVPNEETLYEVVIKWIKADIAERMKYLEQLISKIDLNLLSIEFLKKIKDSHWVTDNFNQKIKEVIEYNFNADVILKISREKNPQFFKFRHKAEKPVIFAIGGESSGMASQSVECFTLGYDKWRYIVPECIIKRQETKHTNVLPRLRCARYYAASASDDYNVYVIGGRNSTALLDECEVFNVKTNQWKYFHRLPMKLFASGAAFLEGELVVVGGYSEDGITDKVWKLEKGQKSWVAMQPLKSPRYFHATVALGGYLFVLGGYNNQGQIALRTCERFDQGCNKWFRISSMQQPRARFGCAAVGNFIYVFGGTSDGNNCLKSVESYNIFTDEWVYESPMSLARHSFSVAVSDHEIYCLGGSDCNHFLHTVEKLSLRTKRWHCVHSMQISRLAPAAAALLVPYTSRE